MNSTNLTFAGDEAGDVSFAFDHGASRHFVVALIETHSPDDLRAALADFRQRNGLPAHDEFSFHRLSSSRLCPRVFECLAATEFSAWAIIVDKTALPNNFRIMRRLDFYVFCVSELIKLIPEAERKEALLILDEFDRSGKVVNGLKRALRVFAIPGRFKHITSRRSTSESLIQVADLVAGATLAKIARGRGEMQAIIARKYKLIHEYRP